MRQIKSASELLSPSLKKKTLFKNDSKETEKKKSFTNISKVSSKSTNMDYSLNEGDETRISIAISESDEELPSSQETPNEKPLQGLNKSKFKKTYSKVSENLNKNEDFNKLMANDKSSISNESIKQMNSFTETKEDSTNIKQTVVESDTEESIKATPENDSSSQETESLKNKKKSILTSYSTPSKVTRSGRRIVQPNKDMPEPLTPPNRSSDKRLSLNKRSPNPVGDRNITNSVQKKITEMFQSSSPKIDDIHDSSDMLPEADENADIECAMNINKNKNLTKNAKIIPETEEISQDEKKCEEIDSKNATDKQSQETVLSEKNSIDNSSTNTTEKQSETLDNSQHELTASNSDIVSTKEDSNTSVKKNNKSRKSLDTKQVNSESSGRITRKRTKENESTENESNATRRKSLRLTRCNSDESQESQTPAPSKDMSKSAEKNKRRKSKVVTIDVEHNDTSKVEMETINDKLTENKHTKQDGDQTSMEVDSNDATAMEVEKSDSSDKSNENKTNLPEKDNSSATPTKNKISPTALIITSPSGCIPDNGVLILNKVGDSYSIVENETASKEETSEEKLLDTSKSTQGVSKNSLPTDASSDSSVNDTNLNSEINTNVDKTQVNAEIESDTFTARSESNEVSEKNEISNSNEMIMKQNEVNEETVIPLIVDEIKEKVVQSKSEKEVNKSTPQENLEKSDESDCVEANDGKEIDSIISPTKITNNDKNEDISSCDSVKEALVVDNENIKLNEMEVLTDITNGKSEETRSPDKGSDSRLSGTVSTPERKKFGMKKVPGSRAAMMLACAKRNMKNRGNNDADSPSKLQDLNQGTSPAHKSGAVSSAGCTPPNRKRKYADLEADISKPWAKHEPSPKASPTCSILKKATNSDELPSETPSPPNKQRRVSFADPPVSEQVEIPPSPKTIRNLKAQKRLDMTKAEKLSSKEPSLVLQSQDSQTEDDDTSTQLDCSQPICPNFVDSQIPVSHLASFLTSPSLLDSLLIALDSQGIKTVGQFCSLTESDVAALPVRAPKIKYTRIAVKKLNKLNIAKSIGPVTEIKKTNESLNTVDVEMVDTESINKEKPVIGDNQDGKSITCIDESSGVLPQEIKEKITEVEEEPQLDLDDDDDEIAEVAASDYDDIHKDIVPLESSPPPELNVLPQKSGVDSSNQEGLDDKSKQVENICKVLTDDPNMLNELVKKLPSTSQSILLNNLLKTIDYKTVIDSYHSYLTKQSFN